VPSSVDEALHVAMRVAIEARDYDRAAALLDLVRTKPSGASQKGGGA